MRKALLAGALIAATFAPVASQAQDYGRDQRQLQEDHRDLRHDRRELQRDRQDLRGDRWRADRHDGDGWRRDGWRAPFAYRSFGVGAVAPRAYWGPNYYANDWHRFHVPPPRYGYYRYVRHYGDLLLINTRNGRVMQVYRGYYR